ncbi:MAG: sigma-70 family RNA polymerase sigma factor [Pseudomonadales bacterium]|nr:sigma-70 family RNA polymerase sigma factor [Pseudomonadales bacterium]
MSEVAQENLETNEDFDLVALVGEGDKKAFEQLFAKYGERVFRYAYRLISDHEKAEEVTNDVMLEIWKHAPKFEGRSRVSTWILGITRHVALNAVRRKEFVTVDIDDAPEAPAEESVTPPGSRDRETLKQGLKTAIAKLSPEHRDVVELTFFHGCSYPEIAEIVQCPTNTVKTRMHHAKKQLMGFMVEAGLDPSVVELAS